MTDNAAQSLPLEISNCCYISNEELFSWIEENKLKEKYFSVEKEKWEKEVKKEANFFSDTTFLLLWKDFLFLQVTDINLSSFLAKTYQLSYQTVCQKVFHEKKNIVLISKGQWKESVVLWKDEASCQKHVANWLEKIQNDL